MAPAPSAKTERLMNLVMTLLWTRRPLTRHDLRRTVEQYQLTTSDEAFERMFERDKDELRALGVPLETVEADPLFDDELGYRIRPDEYELPEISFEPDELVVLGLAARTWSHGTLGGAAAQALRKLQASQPGTDGTPAGPIEPRLGAAEPGFPTALRAIQTRQELRFEYRGAGSAETSPRRVQPWGLTSVHGHWYLTGFDVDREAERVFRLSRVVGDVRTHGRPGAYDIPADARPADVARAAAPAESETTAQVTVRTGAGARLRSQAQVLEDGEEWTRLEVRLPDDSLVSELAMLLDSVRDIAPAGVAQAVREHLTTVAERHTDAGIPDLSQTAQSALDALRNTSGKRGHGSIEPATERLSRLLAMVPWLVHRQGIDVAEAARGLSVTEDQLRADLELLFMCGYGSMPDQLIEVDSESGRIFIENADTIARPLRLGWDEAVTLVVGLRALEAVPGLHDDDAVGRALGKLETAVGDLLSAADRVTARIDDEGVDAGLLATLRAALADRRRVHLVYDAAERDERTERDVDLMRVVSAEGRWYAEGWCHRAQDSRFFRLDRIRSVEVLDVDGTPPAEATPRDLSAGTYQPADDATVVTLVLEPAARWVTEYYPVAEHAQIADTDGAHLEAVRMIVSHLDWLVRLAVRLGGRLVVLEPAHVREQLIDRVQSALAGAPMDAGRDLTSP